MSGYYLKLADTVRRCFGTNDGSGAATTADSTPVVVVLEQGVAMGYSPTVTLIAAGLYEAAIVGSTGNGFEVGKEYSAYVTAVVAGVTSRSGLTSFAVVANGVDDLSTSAALATVQADTDDIQTRLPSALVGGKMDSHVNDIAANAITAASIATDAIDADALKADAVTEIQTGLATAAALSTAQTAITAIKASTDNLPSDPADESLIIAATNSLAASLSTLTAGVNVSHWHGDAVEAPIVTGRPLVDVWDWNGQGVGYGTSGAPQVEVIGWFGAVVQAPNQAGVPVVDVAFESGTAQPTPTTAGIPVVEDATARTGITDIRSRLPMALDDDGNMMSSVQTIVADAIDAASIAAAAVTKIADGIFSYVIEAAPAGATTFIQRLRVKWSVFAAQASGLAIGSNGTEHFRDAADTKDRATFDLNIDGTRTPGTFDGT